MSILFPQKFQRKNEQKGFALLIAVVVSFILISVTYVMFGIGLKQLTLSTAGKNSQLALFAADTGIECSIFDAYKVSNGNGSIYYTPDPSSGTTVLTAPSAGFIKCNGKQINFTPQGGQSVTIRGTNYNGAVVSTFTIHDILQTGTKNLTCAKVTVTAYVESATNKVWLDINSKGYNTCPEDASGNPSANDPQRVERGLETYF